MTLTLALIKPLAIACGVLLLTSVALGGYSWVLSQRLDVAQANATTASGNHALCTTANVAWTATVDSIQTALHTCTRERDEVAARGAEALARIKDDAKRQAAELARWKSQSAAAESLPQCRAVLDAELCSELGDY